MNDDEVKAAVQDVTNEELLVDYITIAIGMLCTAVAILGALKYSVWMVAVGAFLFSFECVMALVRLNFLGVIMSALFAYPHFILIQEIRKGIMTPENYANEEYSCCCV